MNDSARKALILAAVATAVLMLPWSGGVSLASLLLSLVIGGTVVAIAVFGGRALEALFDAQRRWRWRDRQGRHHAFGGVSLRIEDDGRHGWIAGADLQQLLSTRDAEDVLAARHAGRWRRDARGLLWLRVDNVVERLATMPGRAEPRTVRLRRYLEREVLYPSARRRERATGRGGPGNAPGAGPPG